MGVLHRPGKYYDLAGAMGHQGKSALGRNDPGQRPQQGAQPADFDPQPCAMGLIVQLQAKGPGDQRCPRHFAGPGMGQCPCQHQQHRTPGQGDLGERVTYQKPPGIDNQCV
ncbi:hypothetical protein D3C71_1576550 [compost metagenome]